jgi:uncharacterized tellurite resistance protein B-like protein
MILYGTTTLTLSGERGQFYCPRCGRHSEFRQRNVRRFFTLYFIPLIPLNVIDSHVRCGACKGQFALEAKQFSKEDYEQKSRDAFAVILLRAMILIMLADGTIDPAELAELERLLAGNSSSLDVTRDTISQQIVLARQAGISVLTFLQNVSDHLDERQKNEIVRCCFLISTAAGDLREQQMQQLYQFPSALGIQESRFRDIIEEAAGA